MIDHLSSYTANFERSKHFYDAVFAPLGYSVQAEFVAEWNNEFPTQRLCAYGPTGKAIFWLVEVKQAYTPRHMAFSASSKSEVDSFYQQAMANGGTDNGEPGLRPDYHEHYYGAFAFDPDGNNVEAVYHGG